MLQAIARSIRLKLALVVLATTLAALLVAGVVLVTYDLRAYRETGLSDLLTQAEILGHASGPALAFDDAKAAREYLLLLKAKPEVASAAIYNARGKPFATYARDGDTDPALPRLPEAEGSRVEGNNLVLFKRIEENSEILGTVYLKSDYKWLARLASYLGIFTAVTTLSLLVALLIWGWLQAALTKPILATAAIAREVVERRDFSLRAAKMTEDEMGSLVDAFNDMLAEIGRGAAELEATNRSLEREMAERRQADEERARLNAELEQRVTDRTAQLEAANRELEGFSYSVSHDLRAPLRAVVGFSKLLLEDHAEQLDDEARRKLAVIQSEAGRMGQLIDELLAFSRLGRKAMQMTDLDMSELARTTFAGLNGQHEGACPDLHLGDLPRAKGDRVLVGQVWANLLSNAMKFSSKKERPRIEVSAISDELEHVYFVRDNGAGFDPRYRAKLFGVFQRLHSSSEFPGTGVGLALVERIVVRHGGRVWADGKPDEGATFYFTLPKESQHERV
jgi:signal transduction histidine kinase